MPIRHRRAIVTALVVLALAVAGCAPAVPDEVGTTTTTAPPTTTAPTALPTSTTSTTLAVDPAALVDVSTEQLALMPLRQGAGIFSGFVADEVRHEDNAAAAARVPSPDDERNDQLRFGRIDGYRTELRPARVAATDALALDSWVMLFADAEGAHGYLQDWARDVVKDEDVGHGGDLRVVTSAGFVVDDVGDEALGLVLDLGTVATPGAFQETIIAYRWGRMLGFVSVLRAEPGDVRIPTLEQASALWSRMAGVLSGAIEAPDDETGGLRTYAFEYRQALTEEFLLVVYPDPPPDLGEEEPPPGDGSTTTTTSTSTTTTTDASGTSTSSSTSTSTTTTTLLVPTTAIATVDAEGIIAGDDLDCRLRFVSDFGLETTRYVIVDDSAWKMGDSDDPEPVDPESEPVASDLIYCPGWSPDLEVSGLDAVVFPGAGTPTNFAGQPAERFELGHEDLVRIGLAGGDGRGIEVERFTVWVAAEGPWILGLDLTFSGSTAAMERALGPGFQPNATVTIDVELRVLRPNDPDLAVVPPIVGDGGGDGDETGE